MKENHRQQSEIITGQVAWIHLEGLKKSSNKMIVFKLRPQGSKLEELSNTGDKISCDLRFSSPRVSIVIYLYCQKSITQS